MSARSLLLGASARFSQLYEGLVALAETDVFSQSGFAKRGYMLRLAESANVVYLRPNYLNMWLQPQYRPGIIPKEAHARFWAAVGEIKAFSTRRTKKNPEMVVSDETWSDEEVEVLLDALKTLGDSTDTSLTRMDSDQTTAK